jgi:hypothetical protein
MKEIYDITLIDGLFEETNAKEIILTMIDKKIEFNEMSSFRNLVTNNNKDLNLEARIQALKLAKQELIHFLKNDNNKKFKISAKIKIEPC